MSMVDHMTQSIADSMFPPNHYAMTATGITMLEQAGLDWFAWPLKERRGMLAFYALANGRADVEFSTTSIERHIADRGWGDLHEAGLEAVRVKLVARASA